MSHDRNPSARKSNSRGNSASPGPGVRLITSTINCAEINRACDEFFMRTIPGYRVMNVGGIVHPPKRSA